MANVTMAQEIYIWHDEDGQTHYSEVGDNQSSTPLTEQQLPPIHSAGPVPEPTATPPTVDNYKSIFIHDPSRTQKRRWQQAEELCQQQYSVSCADIIQEEICLMRFALDCAHILNWKQVEINSCAKNRGSDCARSFFLYFARPLSLLSRELDSTLPHLASLTGDDLACLRQSGFYCHELHDENDCDDDWGMSCSQLRQWKLRAITQCQDKNPNLDCSIHANFIAHRPISHEERLRKKFGADRIIDQLKLYPQRKYYEQRLQHLLDRYPG